MGVTITMAIAFWLASSYIEYRIIKATTDTPLFGWVPRLFETAFGGIVVSVAIGLIVSWIMGPVAGAGAALGQLLGLATNEFTYTMYDNGGKAIKYSKTKVAETKDFMDRNKPAIQQAQSTIKYGVQALGFVFLVFMFIVGLPARGYDAIHKMRHPAQV